MIMNMIIDEEHSDAAAIRQQSSNNCDAILQTPGTVLARARITVASVDAVTGAPTAVPEKIANKLFDR
jgi:acyl-CoA thioesterase FadM